VFDHGPLAPAIPPIRVIRRDRQGGLAFGAVVRSDVIGLISICGTRMALFDANPADADRGYLNIRAAEDSSDAGRIRNGLEQLWVRYEPYADTGFCNEFAMRPDERFWEMYLAVAMLPVESFVVARI
jgi:hypothetical protein